MSPQEPLGLGETVQPLTPIDPLRPELGCYPIGGAS